MTLQDSCTFVDLFSTFRVQTSASVERCDNTFPGSKTPHQRKEIFVEQKLQRKSEKREDNLLAQAEDLKCQTEVDKRTKTEWQHSFDAWV